jgi:hypothetical protein
MPSKEQILHSIETDSSRKSYTQGEVKHLVNSVSNESLTIKYSKIGDIIISKEFGKPRPAVIAVLPVDKPYAIVIPLTSSSNLYTLPDSEVSIRWLPGVSSSFCNLLGKVDLEICKCNTIGVYEDLEHLKEIVKRILLELTSDISGYFD